jgi:hypothetical protein
MVTVRSRTSRKSLPDDEWYQVGLTVEGKISNFDVVYAGAYLDREVDGSFDYSGLFILVRHRLYDGLLRRFTLFK